MSIRRALTVVAFNVLLLLVLLEGLGAGYYYLRNGTFPYQQKSAAEQASVVPAHFALKQVVFHPYYGYVNHPEREDRFEASGQVFDQRSNNAGFLYDRKYLESHSDCCDVPMQGGDDVYIIGVFGGSVGQGFAVSEQETGALARRLVDAFPDIRDKKIRVLNFSISGFRQPQQLMTLAYFLSIGQRFDLIINIDGFNEVASSLTNWDAGAELSYPPVQTWKSMGNVLEGFVTRTIDGGSDLERLYSESVLRKADMVEVSSGVGFLFNRALKFYHRHRLGVLNREVEGQGDPADGKKIGDKEFYSWFPMSFRAAPETREGMATRLVDVWVSSSVQMNAMAQQSGAEYLHILQPNQWYSKLGVYIPRSPDHPYKKFATAVGEVYPLLVNAGPRLRDAGIAFYDGTEAIPDLSHDYWIDDCCHYTLKGYKALYEKTVDYLVRGARLK